MPIFRTDADDADLFPFDADDADDADARRGGPGNVMLAQALWRTRGDLTKQFEGSIGSPKWTASRLDPDVLGRWSQDVRGHLCSFELTSGLCFDSSDPEKARLFAMEMRTDGKTNPTLGETRLIKELDRPEFDKDEVKFKEQLQMVLGKAGPALRNERMAEILTQVSAPYSFFAMLLNMQPGRHRHTHELMSVIFRFSSTAVMQFKHHLRVRRPSDRSPLVEPVLQVPGHASYPAGHATQCHFIATVLKTLVGNRLGDDLPGLLDKLADRIAENRVIAGLHYVKDNDDGKALGIALAENHFMYRIGVDGSALKWLWGKAQNEWKNT